MRIVLFFSVLFTSCLALAQLSTRHEVVASGLNGPYYMRLENGDLIVSLNEELVKLHLSAGPDENGVIPVTSLFEVPGAAIGFETIGSEFLVMEEASQNIVRVSRGGERTLFANGFDNVVDIVRYGVDYFVTDFGIPDQGIGNRLLRLNSAGETTVISTGPFVGLAGIQVVGEDLYVTDFILGALFKVSQEGEVVMIASGLGAPVSLAWDGVDFLVADFGNGFEGERNGRILRVSKSGRVIDITRGIDVGNPAAVINVGSDIYYSDLLNGQIGKLRGFRLQTTHLVFKK